VPIGDRDDGNAEPLASALPDATLAEVPGNHYTAQHHPGLASAILTFIGDRRTECEKPS
jgi:hypothetical protein